MDCVRPHEGLAVCASAASFAAGIPATIWLRLHVDQGHLHRNMIGQLFVLDIFLGMDRRYHLYGIQVHVQTADGQDWSLSGALS